MICTETNRDEQTIGLNSGTYRCFPLHQVAHLPHLVSVTPHQTQNTVELAEPQKHSIDDRHG